MNNSIEAIKNIVDQRHLMKNTRFLSIPNSQRLHFKLMDTCDKQALFELDQDPEVMKYITGKVTTMDEIESVFIPRMLAYRNPEKGWGIWQVNVTETDEYIGWIIARPMHFFSDTPEYDNLELGWRFKQLSWGKGYGSEAAKAIMEALIEQRGYNYFSAIAHPENQASINIMKKLGMQFVKKDIHKDPLGDSTVVYYQVDIDL